MAVFCLDSSVVFLFGCLVSVLMFLDVWLFHGQLVPSTADEVSSLLVLASFVWSWFASVLRIVWFFFLHWLRGFDPSPSILVLSALTGDQFSSPRIGFPTPNLLDRIVA